MKRLGGRWRPILAPSVAEEARDLVARAQAALGDAHRLGAERQLVQLYDVIVPPLDDWALCKSADAHSVLPALLELWQELPDIDPERESIEELLLWNAGHSDESALPAIATSPAQSEAERAAQRDWLTRALHEASSPRSSWWRRLIRRAQGPLGDCAQITLQRGNTIVLERPPSPSESPRNALATTELGTFQAADRLTLRWQVAVPGRVLILHAVGDEQNADLDQLLPTPESDAQSEGVPRRAQEVVELVGELAETSQTAGRQHSLLLIWGPEMLPGTWGHDVLSRRCVPVGSRVWRYSYSVSSGVEV